MPKPYSIDLRQRAILYIKDGKKYPEIVDALKISLSTVKRYARIHKETGDVKPKSDIKTGRKNIIRNHDKFTKFIKDNKHLSLMDMQDEWKEASFMTIYRGIKNLGYSYKKNSGYIKKETKKKEKNISKR